MSSNSKSAGEYREFTKDEFENALGRIGHFNEVDHEGAYQVVYAFTVDADVPLEVRVFSTIQFGSARDCGNCAIKTVLWHTKLDKVVSARPKTLRINNVFDNLIPKIESLLESWREEYKGYCPECEDGIITEKEGEYGLFCACDEYPSCTFTIDM